MKKINVNILSIVILLFVIQSCEKNNLIENDRSIEPEFSILKDEYNEDFENFSVAVSKALKTSQDFRKIIKNEALLMIDGDYDVILNRIVDKKVTTESSRKSGKVDYSVKDLLEDIYSSTEILKLKSSSSVIDELTSKYPDMQIAVPVHAEDWDEENYVPTVTFLPYEYDDATTENLIGFDSDGHTVTVDAINVPSKPVIVVSENERLLIDPYPVAPVAPSTPTNLKGIKTESGIRLSWDMPNNAVPANTTGYYIYRKCSDNSSFIRIKTVVGVFNKSYDDNAVEAGRSYSFYVIAYYQGETSLPSNYVTIIAPSYPKPVLSFDAIQNSKREIELRWQNDHDQYIQETKIYKNVVDVTNGYQFLKSFSANSQDYFDYAVPIGKKVVYKINHVTSVGESNAKYDFIQVPYRDISQKSPVYIKQIKFTDWRIERWPAGKPEFYITVTNVDVGGKSPYTVQDQINCKFSSRSSTSQVFTGVKVLDWKPGFWFDMLTFTAIEYDRSWGKLTLKASVGFNAKNIQKTGLDVGAGADYEITFEDKGEICGSSYLDYFDNPEKWLEFPNYGVKILISEKDN